MGNPHARQLMEIKLSAIIMESRLRRRPAAPPCRAKGEGRRQRTRPNEREPVSVRRCRRGGKKDEGRERTRACEQKWETGSVFARARARRRERRSLVTTRTMMKRKREKGRIEQMEGERKSGRRETESVRLISPPHAIPHTRASLVPLRAPSAPSARCGFAWMH